MSNAAKSYFAKLKVLQRLVEPYNHRANDAERHIQTAKRHSISTLAGRDSECALANWDKAVQMAELTITGAQRHRRGAIFIPVLSRQGLRFQRSSYCTLGRQSVGFCFQSTPQVMGIPQQGLILHEAGQLSSAPTARAWRENSIRQAAGSFNE